MPSLNRRMHSAALAAVASASLVLASTATIAPTAYAAVASPRGLDAGSAPVLTWQRVKGATDYQIQVDDDSSFRSPEYSATTKNSTAVPLKNLKPGTAHWRVRAMAGRDASDWADGTSFTVAAVTTPTNTLPADGAQLPQPASPPTLRWTATPGAVSYRVEVARDPNFAGAKSYTTKNTSLVVPDALGEITWYWRVTADKGDGLLSNPSAATSFTILPLATPTLTYPQDTFEVALQDVVLDWEPVAGAQTYDVQVATEPSFTNFVVDAKNIYGTRYSPAVTTNNDEFWWRVRAVDANGQPTAWTTSRNNFKRQWPHKPQLLHPLGTALRDGARFFEWTPVKHASTYQVWVSANASGSPANLCGTTPNTTFAPRNGTCSIINGDATFYWFVVPFDEPYPSGGLPGSRSDLGTVTYSAVAAPTQPAPTQAEATTWRGTGLKINMSGSGVANAAKGCSSTPSEVHGGTYVKPTVCPAIGTPVFSWDADPKADRYVVWFAQDENFTTTEVDPISTTNTMVALDRTDHGGGSHMQFPESEAGVPYYWYVQPCRGSLCGPDPVNAFPGLPGAASFAKTSPSITGLSSTSPDGNDVTFSWNDYYDINVASSINGETGTQSAHTYLVEVDNEPSFAAPLVDTATIDQTTYTAYKELYPDTTLYWRVRAIDTARNQLALSATQTIAKQSSAPTPTAPANGAQVAGTAPLEWTAMPFARTYTVELYRNNDTTFSPANRVFSVTTRMPAYAPENPIPSSSTPYVWRVRKTDPSGNVGPWSAVSRLNSAGIAPELISPANGSRPAANAVVFRWSSVQGAASYELATTVGDRTSTVKTVNTAYAPSVMADGTWMWSVRALDGAGQQIGASLSRSFKIDGTAPKVTKSKLPKKAKKAKVVLTFSEPVKGVSKKSVKLTLKVGKKQKKVKLKLKVKGTKLVITPKGKLRKGVEHTLKLSSKITDLAGNPLVPVKYTVKVS